MEKTIKTRTVTKDIKTLDKKPALFNVAKDIAIRTRAEATEQSTETTGANQHQSPNTYAEQKTEEGLRGASQSTLRAASVMGRQTADKTRQELTKRAAQKSSTKQAAGHASKLQGSALRQGASQAKGVTGKSIKQSSKGSIKGVGKTIKTSSKVATGTARSATGSAKAAAKGSQIAARNAARAAQVTSRTAAQAARAAARAVTAFVKMAIAAIKSLVAAIAAGGWIAVVVIVIICLVGLIATSAFGIFFTGGDMGDGNPTLREVIVKTNKEYTERIEEIKTGNPHDELVLSGSQASWTEVLAVFAVKTTTDTDAALDVVTLDEQRQQFLRDIFWEMNRIETRIENREFTEIESIEQTDGSVIEKTVTSTRKTLYIIQNAKSATDMATSYSFSAKQQSLLAELLTPRYASAWQSVLYGMSAGAGDIVEIARAQIGNVGGQPYWSWYGFAGRVEWCACFVSWCANEAGYIESGQIPKFSYCPTGAQWFKDAGRWQPRGYTPNPGDIIFFDWEGDGISDHVGIVESCDGTTVNTIEGNSSDACRRLSYHIVSSVIYGYGFL